jgi:serine/threonine protein kinase
LWPVDPEYEQNWSGRGQHTEFQKEERKLVDKILQVEETLGSTSTAVVQSVRCKRILLARKTIRCNRNITRDKAIDEVTHLNRLRHAHVVRVIGTYIIGQELSILLYPVATSDLENLLQDMSQQGSNSWFYYRLQHIIVCLSNALAYIHQNVTKHMDIKPKNILIKRRSKREHDYFVYIADFGIARSYTSLEATETDGPTMFTRKYAAPEVVDRDKRGLSADVFSMGCVFAEIMAVSVYDFVHLPTLSLEIGKGTRERTLCYPFLGQILNSNSHGDTSYQANLGAVNEFLDELALSRPQSRCDGLWQDFGYPPSYIDIIKLMLHADPKKRPSATYLQRKWFLSECCMKGPEPLEAI